MPKVKPDFNGVEAGDPPEQFAMPQPHKNVNGLRSTPKKTTLPRSVSGLSFSSTPKASPVAVRTTPKSKSLSATTKLTETEMPGNKSSLNGRSLPFHTPENFHLGRSSASVNKDEGGLSATPECFGVVQMETPCKSLGAPAEGHKVSTWIVTATETSTDDETSNLTVGVRVRPLNAREASDPSVKVVVSIKENEVYVSPANDLGLVHQFSYDHCFWSFDDSNKKNELKTDPQEEVYMALVHPLLDKAFEGYNACLFAYGQTGSGKSYSLMGTRMDRIVEDPVPEAGIIPRFCHRLFGRIAQMQTSACSHFTTLGSPLFTQATVEVSYFEIYNEKIHDLLGELDGLHGRRVPLRVREHPVFGPHVVGLSTHGVVSYRDMQEWILVGNSRRATAATEMNEKSSRSHSIFSVILTQTEKEGIGGIDDVHDTSRRSKINLVDLAGSERLSQTSASGDRMREGVSINRSLLTLGKVIAALSESSNNSNSAKKKTTFIPYRDSVLTWLLRESLGGNSRTAMLATVSPANIHIEETLSTLRYATQAGTIVNRVRINEGQNDRVIRELRAEIERLRALRLDYEHQRRINPRRIIASESPTEGTVSTRNACVGSEDAALAMESEMKSLRQRLKLSEDQLSRAERTWAERVAEAEKCKSAEIAFLRRQGLAITLSDEEREVVVGSGCSGTRQKTACLINLCPDPGLSGTLLYILPQGKVHVGRVPMPSEAHLDVQLADILLEGPLVGVSHCTIENNGGKLMLHHGGSAFSDTFVNGHCVVKEESCPLKHGDRLVIGGNHFFLVNNPSESAVNQASGKRFVDFEFAMQELKQAQEAKLKKELEEAKKNAVRELQIAEEEAENRLCQQRLAFEKQISNLGYTVVQQSEMLERVEKAKKELEQQKAALEAALEGERERWLEGGEAVRRVAVSLEPYKSNFFQDLEDVLNYTETAEEDSSLKCQHLEEDGAIGLHEMQCMVKEANSLCRNRGIAYDFKHVQVLNADCLLQTKVKIRNLEEKVVTYWDKGRFVHFLNDLRDLEKGDSIKELFACSSCWEREEGLPFSEGQGSIEGQPAAGIMEIDKRSIIVDTGPVTRALNDSMSRLSSSLLQQEGECDANEGEVHSSSSQSVIQRMMERMSVGRGGHEASDVASLLCSSASEQGEEEEVHDALLKIEEATKYLLYLLPRVCLPSEETSYVSNPVLAVEDFEMAMQKMKLEVLNWLKSKEKSYDGEAVMEGDYAKVVLCTVHDPGATPMKSSLRSPCVENSGGMKRVRFFFPDVNE